MQAILDVLNGYLGVANDFLYGKFLIVLLIAAGIYFTIRTKGAQFRLFPDSFKCIMEKGEEGKTSSFQALMVATASRVGTGNIAGVTTAIVLGGPGAVIWMWIMAILGCASALVESTLAQVYKEKDEETGGFKGGPAYYMQRALGQRWLGIIFAIILILTFGFGFNGLQAYTFTSAFNVYFDNFEGSMIPVIIGVVIAGLTAFVFFSGSQMTSKISSVVVPVMAGLYIIVGIVVFFMNLDKVPAAAGAIVENAFNFEAIFGGFAGSCVVQGIKRGLFSNEAGMGSAPNAAATADVSHPVKQGLVQVLSVFIDTILVCSTTAFMVILAGPTGAVDANGELINGIPFVQMALSSQFGAIGIHFITVCIMLFTFTSIIGNFYYVEQNIKFISESKTFMTVMRLLGVGMVFVGANVDLAFAWNLADVLMGGMATINIVTIFVLGGQAFKVIKDYEKQRKEGKDPVFKAADVGIENVDFWK
ncbi:MAG: alanine/glycine:cation symporter family protein [Eubacterium sp.]|nr:alanine/glycine:cation symporter family protein [Eubacterium sp.]